ncbi:MAG: ABC transporter permease [Actinomycetia bacterium]|nr:ABC transporter permease [Actinomycetes bacterium]
MKPLSNLFVMSVRQALPLRRTIILGLIQLSPMAIYLIATTSRTSDAAFEGLVGIASTILFALTVPVVSIVIGASALGVERRDQTLSFIVLRPISRTALGATKILAGITAAIGVNLIGVLALGFAHAVRFGGAGLIVGLSVGVAIATTMYVSLSVPLGFLTDRAVVVAMAYLLVFENGVVSALPALATLSPWRIGLAAFAAMENDALPFVFDAVEYLDISVTQSITAMVIAFGVGVLLTAQLLSSRDLA